MALLDPFTLLVITAALAAASTLYLASEWSSVRERSLLLWSSGFAVIAVGSALALLRSSGFVFVGIWFSNGLLIVAHALFLAGVAAFRRARLPRAGWWLLAAVWLAMLWLPEGPWWSKTMLGVQSLLVAAITLRAGLLLRPQGGTALSVGAAQLRFVLWGHGLFYLAKAASAVALDAFINLASFRGVVIQVSLVEGVMAIMLLAMSMTGTERHRREERMAQIAARDPLTALDNRRALYLRAPALLRQASPASPGALLLMDIDHFKQVNDLHGHDAGDRLLITLSDLIRSTLPAGALAARLGGDEFVILLRDTSAPPRRPWARNCARRSPNRRARCSQPRSPYRSASGRPCSTSRKPSCRIGSSGRMKRCMRRSGRGGIGSRSFCRIWQGGRTDASWLDG